MGAVYLAKKIDILVPAQSDLDILCLLSKAAAAHPSSQCES